MLEQASVLLLIYNHSSKSDIQDYCKDSVRYDECASKLEQHPVDLVL